MTLPLELEWERERAAPRSSRTGRHRRPVLLTRAVASRDPHQLASAVCAGRKEGRSYEALNHAIGPRDTIPPRLRAIGDRLALLASCEEDAGGHWGDDPSGVYPTGTATDDVDDRPSGIRRRRTSLPHLAV